jgi:hypothetical protein
MKLSMEFIIDRSADGIKTADGVDYLGLINLADGNKPKGLNWTLLLNTNLYGKAPLFQLPFIL